MAELKWKPEFGTGRWIVTEFTPEHNHPLIDPQHIPFEPINSHISEPDGIYIKSLFCIGIRQHSIFRAVVDKAGGEDKVGFSTKDLYNMLAKHRRDEIKDGDAENVLLYLLGKQSVDPSCYHSLTRDNEGRLDKLFWSDSMSIGDYKAFGKVLVFNTTYECNHYGNPFVVFIGVNHHRNTIPFGCALLSDEKEESFRWVLREMIKAGGGAPFTVITDGDRAMAKAIKAELPYAMHWLCLWHILRNVKTNGGNDFVRAFKKCVDICRTQNDFDIASNDLRNMFEIEGKRWASELYDNREKWSEAYLAGYFLEG